ncbi:Retrovirus-related Pol polyprotein from transposon TNT 1-94 [Araneus ventricosus]|uniref:Retrovirus-related Pol polyprotein from transposon TNT 1-94 n=1 Tax=Araneus ventricosus TaxID=182803 RepID=A0A4Y2RMT2_ARAVE|nr:Retrovirus-related Pol polyprotein from transposon TNT 1-94 [Araneus ventricosus]GBN76971.1 Retrovirus-related Pol polyprotein from transposon TNT 1-94 [Araneus ventricosus]
MALNREYTVAPFDGANFSVWNRRVKAIFAAKELDEFLEKEADATNDTEVSKSKKAYAILLTLLDDKILSSLQKEDTAFKIWKALISTYEAKGAVNQILTRKRLATIRKSKETSMRQHIDEILKLISDLRVSGAEVSDIDSIVYILMSLPKEYESVKVALENQPNVNLTLEFVTQRLIDSEALMNDSKFVDKSSIKYPTDNVTFAAKYKKLICNFCSKKGHTSKFCRLKTSKCFSCGKAGHYKRDCPVSKTAADSGARHSAYEITFAAGTLNEDKFIIDSGATSHMCSRKEWFSSLEPASGIIKCASKSAVLQVEGIGIIRGEISNNVNLNLKDVLYVPNLNGQLLSVQKIEAAGFCVIFKKEEVFLEKENKCLLFGHRKNCGQYISDFVPHCEIALKSDIDDLWHRRCGHSCNQSLKQLGLPTISSFCEVCTRAKQCATPVGKGPRRRETVPMVMIHTDICGPIVPKTFAGEQYFMTLIDNYSRFTEVRLLKRKSDAASELKNFCQLNPSVKKIRCDNGKEYVDGEFVKFANEAGIKIDPSPPYTPCLNGVAERANRSLLEKGRAVIFESNLPKNFWGFAVLTSAYINNRMPNTSIDCHTPYYLKYNTHADLKNLRVFGCDAYTLIPNSQRKKLDDKCKKMIFIGYSTMGYRFLDPTTKHIIISKNVKFNEEKKSSNDFNYVSPNTVGSELDAENQSEESEIDIFVPSTELSEDTSEGTVRKSSREKKHPIRFPESEIYQAMLSQEETLKFDDISTLPHSEQQNWKAALDEEMESMKENDVWDLEELPMDRKAISCRWVLRKKRDGKYKARLVARGFMQKEGVDYFETFSPVISMPALRLLLIIMLNENSNVLVLDVKTAFLNGELNETIYMDQPKGYDDNTGRKCKLKKSLYGLKQAPRQWYQKFLNFVNKLGFKQLNSESCIFIRQVNSKNIFMALYVDDLLLGGSDVQEINVIVDMLSKEFKMSKSEKASEFLGIRIEFASDNLFLDQESYILRLLKKYKMLDCNPCSIPIETEATSATFEKGNHFNGPYRELVGSLLYLAYVSRPDILFAVNCLSQLQEHPTDAAWCALKKILRYLKGTAKMKINYKKCNLYDSDLSLYVDADWVSNLNDRKSVSGYLIMFCNNPILWCVNKQ